MTEVNSTIRLAVGVVTAIIIINVLIFIFNFGVGISNPLQSKLGFASMETKILSSVTMGSAQITQQERSYLALYFEHKLKCDSPLECALSSGGGLIDNKLVNTIEGIEASVISDQQTVFTSLVLKCSTWGQTSAPGQGFSPSTTIISAIENEYLAFLQQLKNDVPEDDPIRRISTISPLGVVKSLANIEKKAVILASWCPDSLCPNLIICMDCVNNYIVEIDMSSLEDEDYVIGLVEGFFDNSCGEALAYMCKDVIDQQNKITAALKNSEDAYALISNPFKLS
ncbi:MAG: hypothetical protein GOU99_00840 [Candidatus Altiarchaeota archaeon]|nr:hypothetical protein [Candidatus Altiarchaeota archaeon]